MTTFISYSRVHSEFVVRLAKDLKAAGFDVWLDQLDIPKGARWDDAIEAAVDSSSTFMIVLSPDSIDSQNVKDELSYAIDSGKHILPVVIKPCKIPLRLRRFQYVDFTDKPYKDSLADIKHLLSNTQRLVNPPAEAPYYEQPVSAPVFTPPVIEREPEPPPELPKQTEPAKANRSGKLIVPISLAVVVLAGIVVAVVYAANRNTAAPPDFTSTFALNSPTAGPSDTSTPPPLQFIDSAGVAMRLVSAGDFIMGNDGGMADESPVQTVHLDTFYIDKYEVTNARYKACVDSGACLPPKELSSATRPDYFGKSEFDNYPVIYVDWNMAETYCEWRGARLPTEAEWEKAARGTDGRTYPWGNDISCDQANYFGCQGDTASVTSYESGLSVYGVYNLAGNVDEWVSSLYMPYPYDPIDGREDPNASGERVLRGGSWLNSDTDNEVRSARRHMADPSTTDENIGFRCALSTIIPETGPALTIITPLNGSTATHIAATNVSNKTREAEKSHPASTLAPSATKPLISALTTPSRTATPTVPVAIPTLTKIISPSPPPPPATTEPPPPPPPPATTEPPPPPPPPPTEPPQPTNPPSQ